MSINTIEPAPVAETSRDGRLALDFGAVRPGERGGPRYLQFQVNPAQGLARRSQDVVLADARRASRPRRPHPHRVPVAMDIVLRCAVIFVFLFVIMRAIGRRELSQLQPFDILLLVVLGDLITQGALQSDLSLTGSLLAVGTFAILSVAVSYLSFRFSRLRPILDGEPIVVVQDGRVIERNLRRERLTIDDIEEEARASRHREARRREVGRARDHGPDQLSLRPRIERAANACHRRDEARLGGLGRDRRKLELRDGRRRRRGSCGTRGRRSRA